MWECPDCSQDNELDPDAEQGQIVECLECGLEQEVISLDPLELKPLVTYDHEAEADPDADQDEDEE
jgi:lysine biosynthesis protein LysW